jgi:hypothetical protein
MKANKEYKIYREIMRRMGKGLISYGAFSAHLRKYESR